MRSLSSLITNFSSHRIAAKKLANHIKSRYLQTSTAVQSQSLVVSQLSSRGVLRLAGPHTSSFLQGLVTNDINLLMESAPSAQYCMMLNVQGRVLYDLFLYNVTSGTSSPPTILVDVENSVKQELIKILRRYKLRKKVDIADVSDEYSVWSRYSANNDPLVEENIPKLSSANSESEKNFIFPDPRLSILAQRLVTKGGAVENTKLASCEDYTIHRYKWGIPEGVGDLPPGNCLPLESNLALMNGVNFNKGCYIGQELTARTYHTGVTRKRLLPVLLDSGTSIEADAKVTTPKGRNAGKFRNQEGVHGLALIRLSHVNDTLKCADKTIKCSVPTWWPDNALNPDPTS